MNLRTALAVFILIAAVLSAPAREVLPAIAATRLVATNVMQQIFDEVKTPFKYGVVIQGGSTNELVDCPTVFRSGKHWFMMYVAISNKVGYQTFLARSDDLLHWTKLGKILSFTPTNHWDAWQADGAIALCDYRWDGTHEPREARLRDRPAFRWHRVEQKFDAGAGMEPHF